MSRGPCPLCGSRNTRLGFWGLEHCGECGHYFAPPDTATPASELYGEGYFQGRVYKDYLGEGRRRTTDFAEKLRLVGGLLPRAGRILDVGCAAGFFTSLMHSRGYRVWGVEVSAFAAAHARQTAGVEVYVGQLPEAGLPSGFFDLVSFWDTLEHLPDPGSFLREARRLLTDSGLLLVETLSISSLSRLLLGKRWPLYAPTYHFHYFSRRSLARLLRREGFRVIRAIPIQTYIAVGRRVAPWRYFRSRLLRCTVGPLAGDVILYAAAKTAG